MKKNFNEGIKLESGVYGNCIEIPRIQRSKEEKIIDILEWLYVNDKEMTSAKEWKKELVKQLYILAE